MNFIKNNREMVVLTVAVIGLFVMAASIGASDRGGQAWAYSTLTLGSSVARFLASFIK